MEINIFQRSLRYLISGIFIFLISSFSQAQRLNLKTNLISWATTTPNLGMEIKLNNKLTLDIKGSYNPFTFQEEKKIKSWLIQPELRFWPCESYNGTFWGLHVHGGEYSFAKIRLPFGLLPDLKDNLYEGYIYGGGISLGHHWILSNRWSLEASIGAGYSYIYYEQYDCNDCVQFLEKGSLNYFGITSATVSFIYFIR